MKKWRFEIVVRDKSGDVILHTGHNTEVSRDLELEAWKKRCELEPIASIVVISKDEGKETKVFP